nr:DUF1173 family protein [Rubrivivax gelatinosus]
MRQQAKQRAAVYAGLDDAFAGAPGEVTRPLCLCVPGGVPMYVARHGDGRLVKRMPLSGYRHAPGCPHFGRAAGAAPNGQGTRIPVPRLEGDTGRFVETATIGEPVAMPEPPRPSLLGVLYELWIRAELTMWHPGFAGKRHWGVVRRHLLQAAKQIRTPTGALTKRLYVPEVFSVERAEAIRARREARWNWILREDGEAQPSMVVVGELKTLRRGQRVARAWVKHLPDLPLALREGALRTIEQRFAGQLAMRGTHDDLHMVCIATVVLDQTGAATVVELELMVCCAEWIPLADEDERVLVAKLIGERRRFFKHLTDDAAPSEVVRVAVLHEPPAPTELLIDRRAAAQTGLSSAATDWPATWSWRPAAGPPPALPCTRVWSAFAPSAARTALPAAFHPVAEPSD